MSSRSPSWCSTIGLITAGMVLASGLSIGLSSLVTESAVSSYSASQKEAASDSGGANTRASAPAGAQGSGDTDSWASTVETIGPSTVAVSVEASNGQSQGTGVVLDKNGHIVTNNHVVVGARRIAVSLADGRTFSASVVGTDPSTDIAVIRIDNPPSDLQPAEFANSSDVEVGQEVMAVGTPLGFANTATTGIISALNRPVMAREDGTAPEDAAFISAIQTDASINPGNSGGPLVNRDGKVIGINSSIASTARDRANAGSIGLGFAIPSSTVTLIAQQLVEAGEAKHALLGVRAQDGVADSSGTGYRGAEILEVVSGSAAEKAGLQPGDLVVRVDDVPIESATALTAYVRGLEVGSEHTFTVMRNGKETSVKGTLLGD